MLDRAHWQVLAFATCFGVLGYAASSWWFDEASGMRGTAAPAWVLKDLSGNEHRLAQYRGRPVLLNFWATWCPPCVRELPMLDALHREKKLVVLAIAEDDRAAVNAFLASRSFSMPMIASSPRDGLSDQLGNPGVYPYSVLLNAEGRVAHVRRGELSRSEILELLAELP